MDEKVVPHTAGPISTVRRRMAAYRMLRSIPDNADVTLWAAAGPRLHEQLNALPVLGHGRRRRRLARFVRDMQLINDVLARTPLDGRYWVWAGLLLGWAREGRVLPNDVDADFAFSAADDELFRRAQPTLAEAGFHRWFAFRNSAGELTEQVFTRHGFKFEFFRMTDVDGEMQEFHVYGPTGSGPVELVGHLPRQELEPFEFLGRTWMKPRDHELMLRSSYGDWRTPDPAWNFLDDLSLVAQRPWRPGSAAADQTAGEGSS
jgi:hypothetical protein